LTVIGIDRSEPMLTIARCKLAALPASVQERMTFMNRDMSAIDLSRRFGLVFVAARSFQHLLTIQLQRKSLQAFRRRLYSVSRDLLRGIAGYFQHWLKGWTEGANIPVLDAPAGRRDEFVDPYFKRAKPDAVVLVLKAREPARIMVAIGDKTANRCICDSHRGGSSNTTSTSTTAGGDACFVRAVGLKAA
jgi:hypothetical protein